MGKWLEEYSRLLLAGVAAVMLILMFWSSGILGMIGERVEISKKSYEKYGDFEAFTGLCQVKKPEIVYHAEKQWHAGEVITIEEAFTGRTGEGKLVRVEVLGVTDKNGTDCMYAYHTKEHQLIFQKAGIYELELRAQDEQKRCTVQKVEIPVDNRRG